MPIGKLHTEEGLLLRQCGALILTRDDGRRWLLDGDPDADELLGQRVRFKGVRPDFDLLEVIRVVRC
jgi:hypothetical protein